MEPREELDESRNSIPRQGESSDSSRVNDEDNLDTRNISSDVEEGDEDYDDEEDLDDEDDFEDDEEDVDEDVDEDR